MADLGAFVSGWEGFTPRAKYDYKQYSNGYGTVARTPDEEIDDAEAKRRLQVELDQKRKAVRNVFPDLAPHQEDALTSFSYNVGEGWATGRTRLADSVRAKDWQNASRIMQEYNKAGGNVLPGLVNRRAAEGQMLLGNDAAPPALQQGTSKPMDDSILGQTPQSTTTQKPSFLEKLNNGLSSPGVDAALVYIMGGLRGNDPVQTAQAASQISLASQHQLAELAERRRRIAEEQKARDALMAGMKTYSQTFQAPGPQSQPTSTQAAPSPQLPPTASAAPPAVESPVSQAPGIGVGQSPFQRQAEASDAVPPIMAPAVSSVSAGTSSPQADAATAQPQSGAQIGNRTVPRQATATTAPPDQRVDEVDRQLSLIDNQLRAASSLLNSPYTATLGLSEINRLQQRRSHFEDLKIARGDPSEALKRRALELSVRKGELDLEAPSEEFKVIGQDPLGNPQYGFVNPRTQSVRPAVVEGQSTTPSLIGSNVHGEDYLKSLPPQIAAQIRGLSEGRIPYPTGMAAWKPQWRAMEQHLAQYDPNFDAVNYASRNQTRKDFTAGTSAKNITSFNTAIGHLGHLNEAIDGLNNTGFPTVNAAWNYVARQISPDFAARENKFGVARTAVTEELARAFKGMGATLSEVHEWEKRINSADSPQALRASISEGVKLLESRINSMGETYNRGMGTTKDPMQLLTPDARSTLAKLQGKTEQPSGPAPGTVENGYRFKGGNPADKANWEPAR